MPRVSSERSLHLSALLRFALLVGMAGCSGSRDQEVTRGRDAGSHGEEGTSDAEVASDPGDGDATVTSPGDADASVAASDDATSGADANDGSDSGSPQTGDAGLQDANAAPADGQAQDSEVGPNEAAVGRQLYVSPTGSDSNDGTVEHPLKRISFASTLAAAGDTIWLMDGTFDSSVDPALGVGSAAPCGANVAVPIGAGVQLRAVNPGAVIISATGSHAFCVAGGELRDLDIRRPTLGGAVVESSAGATTITNVKVTNAGAGGSGNEAAFIATGTAHLTIRPGGLTNLVGEPSYTYARVTGNAQITLEGGVIDGSDFTNFSGNAVFHALESGKLVLDGVTVSNSSKSRIIGSGGNATIELKNGTRLACLPNTQGVYLGQGSPTLRVRNATITGCGFAIGNVIYDSSNVTIDAQDLVLENNTSGILLGGSTSAILANVTLSGGALRNNAEYGLRTNVPGSYSIQGCVIAGNGQRGLDFWNVANEYHVHMRSSTLRDNGRSGLFLIGKTGSSLDLGTLASPGANVLQSNNTTNTAQESSLRMSLTTGDVVPAVGNTWNASAQGADAAGHYVSAGAGQTLEVTIGAGTNYNVVNATLRLAESP